MDIQEKTIERPFIRPLDILKCLSYGCTWAVLAIILAIIAGVTGDHSDPIRPGTVASLIISAVTSLVICIIIVSNSGSFTPKDD